MNTKDVNDLVETQLAANGGVCALTVSDGTVFTFTFTLELLERLTERARASGKVVVFIRNGVRS